MSDDKIKNEIEEMKKDIVTEIRNTRDAIRAALFERDPKREIKIVEYNGVKVEIRAFTVSQKNNYVKLALDPKTGEQDPLLLQVHGLVGSCYVPGTNERIFDLADMDAIGETVYGGMVDVLLEAIADLQVNYTVANEKKN